VLRARVVVAYFAKAKKRISRYVLGIAMMANPVANPPMRGRLIGGMSNELCSTCDYPAFVQNPRPKFVAQHTMAHIRPGSNVKFQIVPDLVRTKAAISPAASKVPTANHFENIEASF
jgi:hypothetical protein